MKGETKNGRERISGRSEVVPEMFSESGWIARKPLLRRANGEGDEEGGDGAGRYQNGRCGRSANGGPNDKNICREGLAKCR